MEMAAETAAAAMATDTVVMADTGGMVVMAATVIIMDRALSRRDRLSSLTQIAIPR